MLLGVTLFRAMSIIIAGVWLVQSRLFRLRMELDWTLIRSGLPFVLIAGLHVLRDQIGTLMLAALSSYDAVAHFNLAWRLVASSYFVPTAICAVFVPLLSAQGLTADNRKLIARAAAGLGAVGCAGGLVAWFLAGQLAAVFYGPLAPTVAPLIRSFAILFPLGFLALFLALVLQALYQETHVLGTLVLVTAANLAANWILVPRYGALGAVQAQIVSTLLQLMILAWRLRTLHSEDRPPPMPAYTVFADGSP
jgi:O-antigen/teichoic acid export membrane protein